MNNFKKTFHPKPVGAGLAPAVMGVCNTPLLFLMVLVTCTQGPSNYATMQQIDKKGWKPLHSYSCEIVLNDSLSLFYVDITGRFSRYIPDSLSLIVEVTSPLGSSFCDTLSFAITHKPNRLWADFRFPYCSHVRFSEKGVWRFSFRHYMGVETLTGIEAIGVYIKRETS